MAVFAKTKTENIYMDFIGCTLFLCVLGRMAHVYPMLSIVNIYRRCRNTNINQQALSSTDSTGDVNIVATGREENDNVDSRSPLISVGMMHVIFYSGLRGAVAYSCANIFPDTYNNRGVVMITTTAIVLVTMLVQGPFIIPFIQWANVRIGVKFSRHESDKRESALQTPLTMVEERYFYPLVLKKWSVLSPDLHDDFDVDDSSSGGGSVHGSTKQSPMTSSNLYKLDPIPGFSSSCTPPLTIDNVQLIPSSKETENAGAQEINGPKDHCE